MIKENTVFILGAGASKPFGYPTGPELKDKIIKDFQFYFDRLIELEKSIPNDWRAIYSSLAPKFIEDLKKSNPDSSIDLFLSRNEQYAEIGKIAIAFILMHSEVTGTFHNLFRAQTDHSYFNDPNQDWCSYLFSKMSESLSGPNGFTRLKDNNVKFITFNYDRSFEHLLYDRLAHDFTTIQAIEDPALKLIPFPIIHVYGVLSKLPWQENGKFSYGRIPNPQDRTGKTVNAVRQTLYNFHMIRSMANEIRIIQERNNNISIKEAKELISSAERIFFLGFGYAKENLEVLGLPANLNSKQEIYGTAVGMTDKEIGDLKESIFLNMPDDKPTIQGEIFAQMEKIKLVKWDCRQLIREYL
jgi:hypothetical protein